MISILGVGASRPASSLANGIYSTLKPEYVGAGGNVDVSQAIKNTVISTTELAAAAARDAIHSAGIEAERIGLILADCATPVETIPGESQRTANLLGLKIPAYDLLAGSTSLLNALSSLKDWKEDKLPEYILYVSANSPTQRVNFNEGKEKSFFSDAAGALVISSKHRGKLCLDDVIDFAGAPELGALKINLFGHIGLDLDSFNENYKNCLIKLDKEKDKAPGVPMIISDCHPLSEENSAVNFPDQANSLGCGIFSVLKEKWESLKKK